MKSTELKNLVYCCFADRENTELLNCLKELKSDYNFEIESHKLGEPCNPKAEFQNKCIIICAEKEDDLSKIQLELDKYKDKMKNNCIVVCCPFDCSTYKSKLNAQYCINCSNMSNCISEFKRIFDSCFVSSQQSKASCSTSTTTNQQSFQTR